jgi:dipeptide/tripeptide permease
MTRSGFSRAFLILFLVDAVATGGFGLDDRKATAIYGLYTTATYLMALPGGWLADRLLGAQRPAALECILGQLAQVGHGFIAGKSLCAHSRILADSDPRQHPP